MLVRYKKTCEKIAMGLLSFMPEEKALKKLQVSMQLYETNPNWHLFMWKKEEDFVGLIGVESVEDVCVIQHITVNPSHRGDGIGKAMVNSVQQFLPCAVVTSTEITKPFIDKCMN